MTQPPRPASGADPLGEARALAQRGDMAGARRVLELARKARPKDAGIANMAGEVAMQQGDAKAAAAHFAAACRAAPGSPDYAINHAIALQRLGKPVAALSALRPHEVAAASMARYASVRASCHREAGEMTEAARWYDRVLMLEPAHRLALHGRARVALERGETDAAARFDRALAVDQSNPELWLGKAQALEVAGETAAALGLARQIAAQLPAFVPALRQIAGLELAAGEADFARIFREAATRLPAERAIALAHIEVLAGLDHASKAAAVAQAARARFPDDVQFALLEAVHCGEAGEWQRAEAIFSTLSDDRPLRCLHEARHALRARDCPRAQALIDRVLAADPWNISAWALQGLVWRLAGDDRSAWLSEQDGLVQFQPLAGRAGLVEDVTAQLRGLHATSCLPLGQSLRGGTQTRGILFHRPEPLLAELHAAIRATLEEYRRALPPADAAHPLLRHAAAPWTLAGSWSVRLTGGGDFHTAHIHPQGILSSALYLVVPDDAGDTAAQRGWLEVGRPPPDLGLDLEPLRAIQPRSGHLALFPSFLYHGTTPFSAAERMTVAFDVITA